MVVVIHHRRLPTSRRDVLTWLGGAAALYFPGSAGAVEPEVPLRVQVSLLDRVIPFDRNFAVRVRLNGQLSVAVVVDTADSDSARIGEGLLVELRALGSLGSCKVVCAQVNFANTQALAEDCRRLRVGVVCVTPGLRVPSRTLAAGLAEQRVLTVATAPEEVEDGLILGFALRSGKPRVLVNLTQARVQQVDFRADFLRMAEVAG
jgi:hypothetical protein